MSQIRTRDEARALRDADHFLDSDFKIINLYISIINKIYYYAIDNQFCFSSSDISSSLARALAIASSFFSRSLTWNKHPNMHNTLS